MEMLPRIGLENALAATALALLAACVGLLTRKPAARHAVWLLVLLKLVTPPIFGVPLSQPEPAATVVEPIDEIVFEPAIEEFETDQGPEVQLPPIPEAIPVPSPSWDWAPIRSAAVASWLVGSALTLALAVARIVAFRRLLRLARPAGEDIQARSDELAERVGLARGPAVGFLPGRVCPMLWSFFSRPRLLLPESLWDEMPEDQRDALLVHELAHLRRGDHIVRLLELVVVVAFWWHPVAWWARKALREAEEQCCDAWVVWALPKANRAYASALLSAVEFLSEARSPLPLAASGMGQVQHLRRRLLMIKRGETPRALSRAGSLAVWGAALLLLPLGPSWAQDAPPRAEAPPPAPPVPPVPPLPPGPPGEDVLRYAEPVEFTVEFDLDDPDHPATEEELAKAAVEVRKLEKQLAEARQQLRSLEGRLRGNRRIASPAPARRLGVRADVRTVPDGPPLDDPAEDDRPGRPVPAPARAPRGRSEAPVPPRRPTPPQAPQSRILSDDVRVSPVAPGRPPRAEGDSEKRLRDVEQKLDKLFDLIQELKDHKGGTAPEPKPAPAPTPSPA